MKRFLAGLVVGIVVASVPVAFAEDMIHLVVNGQEVVFPEAPPQIINGYTVVPARPLAEALGAEVKWDEATRTVIVTEKVAEVPAPVVKPMVFERDGALYVETNTMSKALVTKHGVGTVTHSGTTWTVSGQSFELWTIRENSLRYYDVTPFIRAGVMTAEDFS